MEMRIKILVWGLPYSPWTFTPLTAAAIVQELVSAGFNPADIIQQECRLALWEKRAEERLQKAAAPTAPSWMEQIRW